MANHKFAVGEIVLYTDRRFPQLTWKAPYTVVACIKASTVDAKYRIRSIHRHDSRIASEHELSRGPLSRRSQRPWQERFRDGPHLQHAANLNLLPAERRPSPERQTPVTGHA